MADVASALQATCRAAFLGQLAGVSASLLSSLAEFLSGETAVLSLPPLLQWKLFLVVSLQRPPGGPLDFARTLLALATTHMARLAGSAPGAKAEVLLKCSCYALLHSKALSLLDAHELADELRAGGLIEQADILDGAVPASRDPLDLGRMPKLPELAGFWRPSTRRTYPRSHLDISHVPFEVLTHILLDWLSAESLLALRATCRGMHKLADSNQMWQRLFQRAWPGSGPKGDAQQNYKSWFRARIHARRALVIPFARRTHSAPRVDFCAACDRAVLARMHRGRKARASKMPRASTLCPACSRLSTDAAA